MVGEYVYCDLSASSYSHKRRPDYDRMLTDLAEGLIDGVLVYNNDRLTRRPAELEAFNEAARAAKVRDVRFARKAAAWAPATRETRGTAA